MNLILIGYRGAGKSTVGQILARRLDYELLCLDAMIAQKTGMSIPALVEKYGWDRFRQLESETLAAAAAGDRRVLDCGGGIILQPENRARLKNIGPAIWLQADVRTIILRLQDQEDRPSLTGASFLDEVQTVLAEREALYREAADFTIATDGKSPEEIAAEILDLLGR
jgi:shikimate kinase